MTENGKKIEKVARSATALVTWLNKNIKKMSQLYSFEQMSPFYGYSKELIKVKKWLDENSLGMITYSESKRVEIFPIYCRKLAVRAKFR